MTTKNELKTQKMISLIGLLWLASSRFLPLTVTFGDTPLVINAYAEFYLIPIYGIWKWKTASHPFEKKRFKWMVIIFAFYYLLLPGIVGNVTTIFGEKISLVSSYHTIGSIGFLLFFVAVVLFGKRMDCGWNCTCVTAREFIGGSFRDKTLKGNFWWKLRHLKWVTFFMVWSAFIMMLMNPSEGSIAYSRSVSRIIIDMYYVTVLLIPFMGHRNICRFLCPWAATYGLLNKFGFYRILADTSNCIRCGICDRECDMGIPIVEIIHKTKMINTIECMGCERCVRKCPKGVLTIVDFRDKIRSYNMTQRDRGVRVIGGLTLFLLPFGIGMNFMTLILAGLLVLTGIIGYCPMYALFRKNDEKERLEDY